MRVALVHDWLTGLRGGERVLDQVAQMFPDADLFTLVHVPGTTTPAIERRRITASPLSRWPLAATHYRAFLPFFPWAIRRLDLTGYDLVLSISHAFAKSVRVPRSAVHVCYCLTPMRYVWDQADHYLGRGPTRAITAPFAHALRRFDRKTSGPEHVTRFVAISRAVAARIWRHYGRRAEVVHPPVDVERFQSVPKPPDDFYLMVTPFVPYKAEGLAFTAFRKLRRPLVVVGDGPGRARLERQAPDWIRFTGRVSDDELARLYSRCRAFVMPQEEDFGIAAVEAQAAGRPVIAFAKGGALDSVLPLRPGSHTRECPPATGVFFDAQTPDALALAVAHFEKHEAHFDREAIQENARQFGIARFRAALRAQLDAALGDANGRSARP